MNENFYTGWIKVFRSTTEKGWYKKSEYVHLWLHLLLKANHKPKEYFMNGETIMIERGQTVTSRQGLSRETGIKESTVQRILKFFESEQQIEQQTNNRNRIISIVSYDTYQESEQPIEQQKNSKRTTVEPRPNTNKNVKTIKNDNNVKSIEERKQDFRTHIIELNSNENILNDFLLNDKADGFLPYWTEHKPKARKMRFEKQGSWDSNLRLHKWISNAIKWGKFKPESNGKLNVAQLVRNRQNNSESKGK